MITYTVSTEKRAPSFEARQIVESMLLPGEKLIHLATISYGIYWKGFAFMLLALIFLNYSVYHTFFFGVIGTIMLLLAYSTKKYLMLAATDQRAIVYSGIINQNVIGVSYDKIESVDLRSSLPGMIFGYASVIITGTGQLRIAVPFVADPTTFNNDLMQYLLQRKDQLKAATAGGQLQA